mgnify:CR=1 FL=1
MSALFSECGLYRYRLTRTLHGDKNPLLIIGLNPSTADATHNDPTIRRCIGFAERWGHNALVVANLFSYRSTQPKGLKKARFPVGPETDRILQEEAMKAGTILAAWGAHGGLFDRNRDVLALLQDYPLFCLGKTKAGHPRHPLYIRADTLPMPYSVK